MSENEFIQRAVISMCANPKFAVGDTNQLDDKNAMVCEAEELAEALKDFGYEF